MHTSVHGKILERIYSKMLIVVMVGGEIICDFYFRVILKYEMDSWLRLVSCSYCLHFVESTVFHFFIMKIRLDLLAASPLAFCCCCYSPKFFKDQ